MSVAEIKNDLHKMVVETDDIIALQQIKQYFQSLIDGDFDWWNELNSNEKKLIKTGTEQFDKGQKITHGKMRNEINQLFEQKS